MKPLTVEEIHICRAIQALEAGGNEAWKGIAKFIAMPEVASPLVGGAVTRPFTHIDGYMDRFWVLNPYPANDEERAAHRLTEAATLPSARIHHILRHDLDEHPHDHPWDARTIILKGWYVEERLMPDGAIEVIKRRAGDTAALKFGEYHRIVEVSEGGVWTLFITYGYRDTWGFLVDGKKVPWREYLAIDRPGRNGTPATTAVAGA